MKYGVRLEFTIVGCDFCDIEIDCDETDRKVIMNKAIEEYHKMVREEQTIDFYAGNCFESSLDEPSDQWEIEELVED